MPPHISYCTNQGSGSQNTPRALLQADKRQLSIQKWYFHISKVSVLPKGNIIGYILTLSGKSDVEELSLFAPNNVTQCSNTLSKHYISLLSVWPKRKSKYQCRVGRHVPLQSKSKKHLADDAEEVVPRLGVTTRHPQCESGWCYIPLWILFYLAGER